MIIKLIDANELLKKAHDIYIEEVDYRHRCIDVEDVQEAPAIDAVQVVRCKDCKWYKNVNCRMKWANDMGFSFPINHDDDYCSYGERKKAI